MLETLACQNICVCTVYVVQDVTCGTRCHQKTVNDELSAGYGHQDGGLLGSSDDAIFLEINNCASQLILIVRQRQC